MAQKRKFNEATDIAEEGQQTKRIKPDPELLAVKPEEDPPTFSFSLLPDDIFSHHILKLFDFKAWLRLVIVCKQWYLAAQRSHLPQQLIFEELDLGPATLSILAKYRITTLVVDCGVPFEMIKEMLNTAPSITTLVVNWNWSMVLDDERRAEQFTQITTLSTDNLRLLDCFPNVTRLKISNTYNLTEDWFLRRPENFVIRPKVTELEIIPDLSEIDWLYLDRIRTIYPSLVKLYMLCSTYTVKEWERLEDFGEALGMQIICRNPHLSERADEFSLTSITYHEYFNAFGKTPLQNFLYKNEAEKCRELFMQYSSKQYEKDLFHRQPQFTFPLLGPRFTTVASRLSHVEDSTIKAMVECGYMDYWKALRLYSWIRSNNYWGSEAYEKKGDFITFLQQAKQHMPPTDKALKSTAELFTKFSASVIADMIGAEAFKLIANMRDKKGRTLLHYIAQVNITLLARKLSSLKQCS